MKERSKRIGDLLLDHQWLHITDAITIDRIMQEMYMSFHEAAICLVDIIYNQPVK